MLAKGLRGSGPTVFLEVCRIYIYTYIYIDTYIHTYIHTYMYTPDHRESRGKMDHEMDARVEVVGFGFQGLG